MRRRRPRPSRRLVRRRFGCRKVSAKSDERSEEGGVRATSDEWGEEGDEQAMSERRRAANKRRRGRRGEEWHEECKDERGRESAVKMRDVRGDERRMCGERKEELCKDDPRTLRGIVERRAIMSDERSRRGVMRRPEERKAKRPADGRRSER